MARAKKPKKKLQPKPKVRAKPRQPAKRSPKPKPHKSTAKLSPRNRRKLAAAKGAATRKANEIARREAESKAARARRAKKAKRERAEKRKAKATARQLATRAQKGGGKSLLFTLEAAYGTMRDASPFALALSIEHSPVMEYGTQPWLLLGRLVVEEAMTWQGAGELFQIWENDFVLEATVNPQRWSRIQVYYQRYDDDGEPLGEPQGWGPSSGAWNSVVSEARVRAIGDPEIYDDESFAVLYANSAILEIVVWWSAGLA